MKLTDTQMIEIAQHAFTRMDGAWFLALAKKFGVQTAWEMDVEAWKHFSYVFGKYLRKNYLPHPVWPASFGCFGYFQQGFKNRGTENPHRRW